MRIRNLTMAVAVTALAASSAAFAQSHPGAGSPSNTTGAPSAPNASVAPSMVPNGAGQGAQAGAMSNSGTMSADQGAGAQTPQPGMQTTRKSKSNSGSMSSGSMSSTTTTPSTTTPPTTPPN